MMQSIYFFCFLAWVITGHAGECTGALDDEQVEFITWTALADQMDQRQEKLLVLGIVDSAIEKLQNKFPELDIVSLDNPTQPHTFGHTPWENQYDKFVVYLALEKNPFREQKLHLLYRALKPGKTGTIICIRKDSPSIDRWVSQFMEIAELTPFVSNTPNLSLEDYRTLFQSVGFHISQEYQSVSILTYIYEVSIWLCDRWAIPLPLHSLFLVDFSQFLRGVLSEDTLIYSELRTFTIRK